MLHFALRADEDETGQDSTRVQSVLVGINLARECWGCTLRCLRRNREQGRLVATDHARELGRSSAGRRVSSGMERAHQIQGTGFQKGLSEASVRPVRSEQPLLSRRTLQLRRSRPNRSAPSLETSGSLASTYRWANQQQRMSGGATSRTRGNDPYVNLTSRSRQAVMSKVGDPCLVCLCPICMLCCELRSGMFNERRERRTYVIPEK